MKKGLLLGLLLLFAGSLHAQFVLSTVPPLTGGTSTTGGITFILRANSSAFIDTVYCRFTAAVNSTTDFRLWYSATDTSGPVTVSAPNWTMLQDPISLTVGTPNQLGVPQIVAIPITGGLLINAGSTYRFYVGILSGSVSYNSLTAGTVDFYTDGNLTIGTGALISYAGAFPSPTINPRAFNGGVAYRFATGLDARPSALINPQTLMVGVNQVTVRVQNAAATPITSATIGYQVDNDPAVITANHTFNTAITPGQTEDYTFPTPINVTGPTSINLKVWTTNANGNGPDVNTSNDTLYRALCTGISGSFTIGGPTADYPDINSAVQVLNTCGVTGPVSFSINPGTYYGSYVLGNIPGANSLNQITFSSFTGQASDVILIHDTAATVSTRSHFVIGGSSRVSLQYLTFRRITVPSSAGQSAVMFTANAESGQVVGCVFDDQTLSTSSFNTGLTSQSSYGLFLNNQFSGFYYAIYLEGQAGAPWKQNNTIQNNTFQNYTYRCIYSLNQDFVNIDNNQLQNFQGISTAGAGIWLSNQYAATVSNNRIAGGLSAYGIITSNLNADTLSPYLNTNRVYNNVITGEQASTITSTTMIIYPMYFAASFSATAVPANPRDAVEIVNNTIIYNINTTSTSTGQAGVYFLGGSTTLPGFAYLHFRNNHVEVNPIAGSLPTAFRLMRFANTAIIDSLISGNNNYIMTGATLPPYFRENGVGTDYTAVTDWQTLTSRDTLSGSISPAFISQSLPIPTSIGFDNRGAPISFVTTDISGAARSFTTPDIGAYEFVGSIFSQINYTPLADTLINTQRLFTVNITDSISTIDAGTARLFYKKSSQTTWLVDSVPGISGTDYTFLISYAGLGGVSALDTIQYYVAVRNATNTVTTAPLGGNGLYLSNQQLPPSVHYYLILPVISGNYNVGVSGPADFPTITAAANFINNGLLNGAATFTLIDSAYGPNETFPILITGRPGSSTTNTITIKPAASRNAVVVDGAPLGTSSLFILENLSNFIWDGSNNGTTSRNLQLVNNSVSTTSAVIHLRNQVGATASNILLKNLHITGNSNSAIATYGIHLGALAVSTTGLADGFSAVRIQNNKVEKAGTGIYVRGSLATAIQDIRILDNEVGSVDTANFICGKGIDLQNALQGLIQGNEIYNMLTTTTTAFAGIEIGGTASDSIRVNRNHVHDITSRYFTLPAVYGINVAGGTNAIITNNLVHGIVGGNYSNVSNFYNPAGIRLASGTGHMVYYNSVNMYGAHTNTNTASASAPTALNVYLTSVTSLDIRNNIFANSMTSTSAQQTYATAIWLPTNYPMPSIILNNNAYQVPVSPSHFVGRIGTVTTSPTYVTVADWKVTTQAGIASNDNLSVPPITNGLAPFISNTNLNITAGSVTGIESGAVVIPVLGLPNTDYLATNRPAGTGVAPDMGAYEFAGVALPDIFPPTIDSVTLSPNVDQCLPTARSISVYAKDNTGGKGIDSVMVEYTVNGVAQTGIRLTLNTGTVLNGVWTGTVPPAPAANQAVAITVSVRDSLNNFAPPVGLVPYKDDYLVLNVSNDTTIVQGDSATLRAGAGFAGGRNLMATTAGGNGQSGVTFNITALQSVLLDSINTHLYGTIGGTSNMEIWYTTTAISSAPNISSPSWTQIQPGYAAIIGNSGTTANGVLTGIPIPGGLLIPAGSTYGIYIGGGSLAYTSHVAGNISNFTDGIITLENGPNVGYGGAAPLPTFHPRQFNGSVTYRSAANVNWTTIGGGTAGQGDTIRVSPLTTTTYVATISDANCSKSDTVTVTVNPLNLTPDVGVSRFITPTSTSILDGTVPVPVTVMIRNYGPVPATGFDVEYRINGGASVVTNSITSSIAPGDSLQHTFTVSWTPTLSGTIVMCANTTGVANEVNRANDTSCISLVSTVSIEVLSQNNRLIGNVYPNPASSYVNFEFNEFQGKGLLEIHDKLGRVVATIPVDRQQGDVQTVQTESWSAGIYSYRFVANDQVQQGKLVVSH